MLTDWGSEPPNWGLVVDLAEVVVGRFHLADFSVDSSLGL